MPIYTYRCKNCGYEFEKRQRMADDPLTECIRCETGEVRRIVNSVGIVFKGSGFYVTDNRNGKNKGKTKTNGSGESKAADADSTKISDSKNDSTEKTAVADTPSPKKDKKAEKKE